ncbi:MAG: hypothetical protein ACI3ZQ_08025 [Candidatus Cryptobacteroides sp.]
MAKKLLKKNSGYKWEFENIGGSTRVKITKGEDLKHLAELDRKMWTVLSCPTKGLEIDEKSLAFIAKDNGSVIHLDDVVATSQWITSAVKDADLLLKKEDFIDLNEINTGNEAGQKIFNSAKQILGYLGKDGSVISLADIADSAAIFGKTIFNGDGVITDATAETPEQKEVVAAILATQGKAVDRSGLDGVNAELIEKFYAELAAYAAWKDAAVEAPFGDKTDEAIKLYNALDSKVKDFFMRSRLAAFAPDSVSALDVQTASIATISADNLSEKVEEIAAYPIARVTGKSEIALDEPVNPAWAAEFNDLMSIVVPENYKTLTEEDWNAIGAKFTAYTAWVAAKAGSSVEALGEEKIRGILKADGKASLLELVARDLAVKEDADNIALIDKFLHIRRDFFTLLKNFVTFQDFYSTDKSLKAIFQVGTLIIDQRACRICLDVADAGKHAAMAPASGMYLLYCDCTEKLSAAKRSIVAAITSGDVGDLYVGKNALFYDNKGLVWNAVVTKIVENPISIGQAFWSPYRRMAKTVENMINKSAAEKDAKIMAEANAKITAAPAGDATAQAAAPKFDIAKFAGIFAAIGMALGMIGTFLASLAEGIFALKWWQDVLVFVGILLIISGPSMIMAWMKLRRRNISPLLNANGWAMNASSNISIMFGATLTDVVKFPKLKLKDPYAKKGLPVWQRWLIATVSVAVVVVALWLCNLFAWAGWHSPFFPEKETVVIEEVIETPTETVEANPADAASAE